MKKSLYKTFIFSIIINNLQQKYHFPISMKKLNGIFLLIVLSTIPVFLEIINSKTATPLSISDSEGIAPPALPPLSLPEDVRMRSAILNRIDSIAKDGIQKRIFPGCQISVMKDGKRVYDKCFGNYTRNNFV